jgi:hypothetical protein
MGTSVELSKLPKKVIIIILKLVYNDYKGDYFDLPDLNTSITRMGIHTTLNLDTTFVYESIKLNLDNIKSGSLTIDNLKLPELIQVNVTYEKIYTQVITDYYEDDINTYSKDERILNNFYDFEGDDYIDIDISNNSHRDYGDSEYVSNSIVDVK